MGTPRPRRHSPRRPLLLEGLEDRTTPALTLSLAPGGFVESAGAAATGTVTRTGDTTNPLTVSLLSSDPSEATVPASVTIPAGQESATFPIAAVNDAAADGTQRVRITAWADGPTPTGAVTYDPAFRRPYTSAVFSVYAMAVQPDGKVLSAAWGNPTNLTVTRHLPDGTPDPTFDSDGVASVPGTGFPPSAMAVAPDGKIVIARKSGVLTRLNPNGSLDSTFGGGNVAVTLGGSSYELNGVAVQPDGKVVAAGWYTNASNTRDAVALRYNADGTPDATFGTGGRASVTTYSGGEAAYGLTLLPDGKVVVLGTTYTSGNGSMFFTARFTPDGLPDPDWGNTGAVTLDIHSDYDIATGAIVQPDGKLVVGGSTGVVRYNTDGSKDVTFGQYGVYAITPYPGLTSSTRIARLPDGRLVIGGLFSGSVNTVKLILLSPDGVEESAAVLSETDRSFFYGAMALAADGSVYVGVETFTSSITTEDRLERFRVTVPPIALAAVDVFDDDPLPPPVTPPTPMTLVLAVSPGAVAENAGAGAAIGTVTRSGPTTFALTVSLRSGDTTEATVPASVTIPAGAASATFPIAAVDDTAFDGTQRPALAAWTGATTPEGAITRDTSFLPPFPGEMWSAGATVVQPDGKIVSVGRTANARTRLVRHLSDGTLDPTFGVNGVADAWISAEFDMPSAVLVQPDGRIVVGGLVWAPQSIDVVLARFNPDGSLDPTFGVGGRVGLDLGPDQGSQLFDLALQSDGKILAGGQVRVRDNDTALAVLRFNTDGSLDTTYGVGGRATFDVTDGRDYGYAMALQPDGKVVLVGQATYSNVYLPTVTLVRFTASGQPDPTFGFNGRVQTDLRWNLDEAATDVALQSDGKIVVSVAIARSGTSNPTQYDAGVVRYLPDGTLDATFGQGGLAVYTSGTPSIETRVAVLPDGRVLLARGSGLLRFSPTGVLEAVNLTARSTTVGDLAVLSDGNAYQFGIAGTTTVTAYLDKFAAGGPPTGRATLEVLDNDPPPVSPPPPPPPSAGPAAFAVGLTVTPVTVYENAGASAATATVTRSGTPLTDPLVVNLVSSNPALVAVPATVTIPAGQASVTFAVGVTNDSAWTGTRVVTITATTAGSSEIAPDPSFGTGGFRDLAASIGWSPSPNGMALMPDGRVVAAGASTSGTASPSWVVFRTLPDGRPDNSFGFAGTVTTPFPNALPGVTGGDANAVAVQPDGKVIVVGTANGGFLPADDWAVARYNPDGSLDTAFGYGGFFRYEMPTDRSAWLYDVALQPDGKILITGSGTFNFAVARLTADGQLDPTFGVGGIVTHDVGPVGSQQYPTALAVQADGKILVAGWTAGAGNQVVVARLNPDGSLDSTYGTGGVAAVPVAGGRANAVTVQPDGKALVAGYGQRGGGRTDWLLARFTAGGVPDPTFSGDGVTLLDFTGESDTANDVLVLADGKILVAGGAAVGTNAVRTAFARYLPDGRLDPSFGTGGTYVHPASGAALFEAFALAVQPDGRVLTLTRTFSAMRVGRFLPGYGSRPAAAAVTVLDDETLPPSSLTISIDSTGIAENGWSYGTLTRTGDLNTPLTVTLTSSDTTELTVPASVTIPAGQASATFVATAVDDTLLDGPQPVTVTASANAPTPGGTITADTTFNLGSGRVNVPYRSAMTVAPDGRVVVVGPKSTFVTGNETDFAVSRVLSNGTLDSAFGSGGVTGTDVTGQRDEPEAVAVLSDGKVLVAGTGLNGPATALVLARFLPDGLLDPSFGNDGRVVLGGPTWVVRGLTLQADGKILVAGSANGMMAVARFLPDGTPDGSFGTGGTAAVVFGEPTLANAVAVRPDGKIVVAGEVHPTAGSAHFAVARFNADGTLDPTFGLVLVDITVGDEVVRELVLQPDGKILLGGPISRPGTSPLLYDVALVRLTADGDFDTGFGSGGAVVTPVGGAFPNLPVGAFPNLSVGLLPDGRIVAAFTQTSSTGTNPQARFLRYTPAGVLEANVASRFSSTTVEQMVVREDGFIYLLYASGSSGYLERYRGLSPVTAQVSVQVLDNEPFAQAVNNAYSVAEDNRLVVGFPGVRYNDVFRPDAPPTTVELVTGPTHGTLTLGSDGSVDYLPDLNYFGPDSFTYRLVGTGFTSNTATVSITVTPVNDAPTAVGDAFTVGQGYTLTVGPPEGVTGENSLVMTSDPGDFVGGGRSYNFGPASGTYTLNGSPSGAVVRFSSTTPGVWWDLWFAAPLGKTFVPGTTYPASNWNQRNERDAAISVSGEGRGPGSDYNGELTVLQAEYDPYGFPTRFAARFVQRSLSGTNPALRGEVHFNYLAGPWGVRANDSDVEPDYLTAYVVAGPAHGALTLNPDGTLRYVPDVGFSGIDSFTYRAFDGALYSDPATVTITVTPTAAATAGNDSFTVNEDQSLWVGPDMAAAGQYRLTAVSAPGEFVGGGRSYDLTPPAYTFNANRIGTTPRNAIDLWIVNPSDTLDWWSLQFAAVAGSSLVPGFYTGAERWPFNAPGRPGMSVSAHSNGPNTLVGGFTVRQIVWDEAGNPVRFAADFVQDGNLRGTILHNYIPGPFGVLLNDADPDGDPVTAELVTGPAHGTLTLNPDGSFRYAPEPDFSGTDSFTYRARDGSRVLGAPATVTLAVNPVNDAPRFTKGPDVTVLEDAGPQTLPTWATGIAAGPPNESGQAVAFEVVGNTNPGLFAAGPAVAPTGALTFTLAADANGSATIQVRLRDDGGTFNGGVDVSAPQSFTITATAVPDVASVVVNAGAAQRSKVTEIAVTFDMEVDPALLATAFALARVSDGAAVGTIAVATQVVGGRTVATLTFSGANTEFGSLADGRWVLSVDDAKVKSLTGVGMAADSTYALHRFFGDSDGDADVDLLDLGRFRQTYGKSSVQPEYLAHFDFDADGDVDLLDLGRFRQRYGRNLP